MNDELREDTQSKRAENLYPGDRVVVWGPDLEVRSAQPFGPGETIPINGFLVRGPGTKVSFLVDGDTFDAFYPPGVHVEYEVGQPTAVEEPEAEPEAEPVEEPERASGGLIGQTLPDYRAPEEGQESDRASGGMIQRSQDQQAEQGSRIVPAHDPGAANALDDLT